MTDQAKPSAPEGETRSKDLKSIKSDSSQDDSLPPLGPLGTKTPVLNQQNNFYTQIPSSAWEPLSSEQIVDLSKAIIETANTIDERHFQYAMDCAEKRSSRDKLSHYVGGLIAFVGILGAIYLASIGHEIIAMSISAPLATIIAVIVGRRFL